MMKPRILDLFSGIGGFSLGLERAGMQTVAFCESDEQARLILKKHWPLIPIFNDIDQLCRRTYDNIFHDEDNDYVECSIHRGEDFGDCECIGADEFLDTIGSVDVICGGAPCQPFSRNGHRKGASDPRHKWPEMRRVIRELQPLVVLFENVAGAIELIADTVCSDLEEDGYASIPFSLEAGSFGAEHHRQRLIVVAYNQSERIQGMRPQRIALPQPLDFPFLPVRNSNGIWQIEPDVRRSAYGVSSRLDGRLITWGDRLRLIGNSICPQVVEVIGRGIMAKMEQAA